MTDIVQDDLNEINSLISEINQTKSGEYNEIDIEDSIYRRPIWTSVGATDECRGMVQREEN
jgi:hypothetical protein